MFAMDREKYSDEGDEAELFRGHKGQHGHPALFP
jgi:hypothetical protein